MKASSLLVVAATVFVLVLFAVGMMFGRLTMVEVHQPSVETPSIDTNASSAETETRSHGAEIPPKARVGRPGELFNTDTDLDVTESVQEQILSVLASVPTVEEPTGDESITGVVVTRDGEPLEGTSVYLFRQDKRGYPTVSAPERVREDTLVPRVVALTHHHRREVAARQEALTDSSGGFEFTGLARNAVYSVRAHQEGWRIVDPLLDGLSVRPYNWKIHTEYGTIKRDVRPGDNVELVGEPVVALTIQVEFEDGSTPEVARVFHWRNGESGWSFQNWYPSQPTLFLKPGSYEIRARVGEDHEFKSDSSRVHLTPDEAPPALTFTVVARTAISGRVIVRKGEDQQRFWVYLAQSQEGDDQNAMLVQRGEQKSPGRAMSYNFWFKDLPAGPHVLSVGRSQRDIRATKIIDIEEGQVHEVEIEVPPLGASDYVEVNVVGPSGGPVDDATFAVASPVGTSEAWIHRGPGTFWVVYPQSYGTSFEPSDTAPFTFVARSSRYGTKKFALTSRVSHLQVEFEEAARLTVSAKSYAGGPLEGVIRFRVQAFGAGESRASFSLDPLDPFIDSHGKQRFSAASPGACEIVVEVRSDPGWWSFLTSQAATLISGDNEVSVALPPVHTVTVVTNPEHARETLLLRTRSLHVGELVLHSRGVWRATVNDAGEATISRVPTGSYLLGAPWGSKGLAVDVNGDVIVEPSDTDFGVKRSGPPPMATTPGATAGTARSP